MKYFTIALFSLIPVSAHAEEIVFVIDTTYASSEVEVSPTSPPPGRAGRQYIKRLNESSSSQNAKVVEETVTSDPVPVAEPVVEGGRKNEDCEGCEEKDNDEEEDIKEYKAPVYNVKEQEELDELTLEQLEEYADEAQQNLQEQLAELANGFTIMGSSVMDYPLSPTQRSAILRRSIRTVDQLKIFTKALSESDANIRQIIIADTKIEISYRQKAKLFGLIPLHYLLKTTVEDGEVSVQQPWWHFLARDDVKTYQEELQNQLDVLGDIDPEDPDLEAKLQKQQQTLQTISTVSKVLHDTGMLPR